MTIQIYVGTYAKYNNGSIGGAWIDLEGHDEETFYEACRELHKDEADPELMFQDFEGFPKAFYGECSLDDRLWHWVTLDERDREMWEAYIEGGDDSADFETAENCFYGQFDSDTALAYEYIESTEMFLGVPDSVTNYFDYESFGRDLAYDFSSHNGYYFNNY